MWCAALVLLSLASGAPDAGPREVAAVARAAGADAAAPETAAAAEAMPSARNNARPSSTTGGLEAGLATNPAATGADGGLLLVGRGRWLRELTPAALFGFIQIGSLVLWEVVEDDLVTLSVLTALGAGLGALIGAVLLGGALLGVGVGLVVAGVATPLLLWIAIAAAGALGGGTLGLCTGLPVGASLGLAASIDEGELTLRF